MLKMEEFAPEEKHLILEHREEYPALFDLIKKRNIFKFKQTNSDKNG